MYNAATNKLYFLGAAGFDECHLPPGTTTIQCQYGPSGHVMIPIDHYEEGKQDTGGIEFGPVQMPTVHAEWPPREDQSTPYENALAEEEAAKAAQKQEPAQIDLTLDTQAPESPDPQISDPNFTAEDDLYLPNLV